jgi:hypothetical protein
LQDVLPCASLVVDAEVVAVLATGPPVTGARVETDGWTGPLDPDPWQLVTIRVHRTLRGSDVDTLCVFKPVAPYTLTAVPPTRGVFLLSVGDEPEPVVLGRYGPQSWTTEDVVATLRS